MDCDFRVCAETIVVVLSKFDENPPYSQEPEDHYCSRDRQVWEVAMTT